MFGAKNHRNPSVMEHSFSRVPQAEIPRSSFDRSHGHKTTFDAGYLVPFYVDEALPGDTFKLNATAFARLATPIFPLMDNMYMDTHFFFIPNRLVWDNWAKFNGEQTDPGDSTDFTIPQITATGTAFGFGSLFDYLGVYPNAIGADASALFSRAYNLTWNTWFRDQNLQDSVVVDRDDGPDAQADYVLLRRGKRHDYFTSSLPWPQKGDAVQMSLGTSAPVTGTIPGMNLEFRTLAGGAGAVQTAVTSGTQFVQSDTASVDFRSWNPAQAIGVGPLIADLSAAIGPTINAMRQSFQIQKLLERDARGGTRYIEIIRAHFGVTSPDMRLQRPEYLGGGSTPINITAVPQTGSTDATSPQGNLAAIGVGLAQNHGFTASFTEHGIILGLVSVRADLTYQYGTNRMFHRLTRYDFYWPALSHLGEQAVLRKEIWNTGTDVEDNVVFGYQERHADYRYKPSLITGLFRSTAPGSLDAWHLSQEFASAPVLDAEFIVENPPIDRVIAVPTQPHFLFDSYIRLHCARPMPVYGVPGLVDHF